MALSYPIGGGMRHPVSYTQGWTPVAADPEGGARKNARAVFEGESLQNAFDALSPLMSSLKNAFVMFNEDGILVHAGVGGEQLYVPIQAAKMAAYEWRCAEPAVFLANVDGRRGVLDAFRVSKTAAVTRVVFEIENYHPLRVLTQLIYSTPKERAGEECDGEDPPAAPAPTVSRLVKHEFSNYSLMLPSRPPSFKLLLSKAQLNKVLGVCRQANERITFQYLLDDTFTVFSGDRTASFPVEETTVDFEKEPEVGSSTSCAILARTVFRGRKALPEPVVCFGTGMFKLTLEGGSNFKQLVQRLKPKSGGVVFNVFVEPYNIPMLGVTTQHPVGATMFFVCALQHQLRDADEQRAAAVDAALAASSSAGRGAPASPPGCGKRRAEDEAPSDGGQPPRKLPATGQLFKSNFVMLIDKKTGNQIHCVEPLTF
ncbi:DNA polymerase processivity subunit [Equid alphaherpesvirus 3]|uniref:DNA polymerase processivity factor n=1 Tax=Equid alphaherpesvirus 3 TaxID=80341 RepID=A0A077B5X2_9ALPH|nr:DNA polymerase processivity subunit [Equid alphaherpesvirus 3]AIL02935.1 DNA polymerase processivity subunit [Equid alphaherpesvirus 3]